MTRRLTHSRRTSSLQRLQSEYGLQGWPFCYNHTVTSASFNTLPHASLQPVSGAPYSRRISDPFSSQQQLKRRAATRPEVFDVHSVHLDHAFCSMVLTGPTELELPHLPADCDGLALRAILPAPATQAIPQRAALARLALRCLGRQ